VPSAYLKKTKNHRVPLDVDGRTPNIASPSHFHVAPAGATASFGAREPKPAENFLEGSVSVSLVSLPSMRAKAENRERGKST
jgi:hypothetical protein